MLSPHVPAHIVSRPQILYNTLHHSTTLYSLQLYSSSTVYNLYTTPLFSALKGHAAEQREDEDAATNGKGNHYHAQGTDKRTQTIK